MTERQLTRWLQRWFLDNVSGARADDHSCTVGLEMVDDDEVEVELLFNAERLAADLMLTQAVRGNHHND